MPIPAHRARGGAGWGGVIVVTFPTLQVVDYKRLYKLGSRHTQKALVLAIGTQTRTWKMDTISNHRFSQARACGGALWLGRLGD